MASIPKKDSSRPRREKPSYPPRKPGASRAFTGRAHARPYSGRSAASSPFPQKPPYRPNGPNTRGARTENSGIRTARTYTPRSGGYDQKPSPTRKFKTQRPPRVVKMSYSPTPTESWSAVATWYDDHLGKGDTYHEKVILPNLTRLVAPRRGEKIVDIACGTGFFASAFAKEGATLTGIDVGEELIAIARSNSTMVSYHVGSAEKIDIITDNAKDKAIIVLAIQNIEHCQKVFNEAFRILKKGGSFHIVMNHPAFRIPKQSSWAFDEKTKVQYRRVDSYLSESRSEIDMHPGIMGSPKTISFHRPLQYYFKALAKAGFVVDRLEEWTSLKESNSGPRAVAENNARKEFPLFLYLGAKKV